MKHNLRDRVLALAGVFQSAALVKQIANQGKANNAIIETSIETLFRFDAHSTEEIFGSIASLKTGLETLRDQFSTSGNRRDLEITRYVMSLIVLERKLFANPTMLDLISTRLKEIESQMEFFSLAHENTFIKLGEVYRDTISTLGPKIMVSGEQPYLDNNRNASKVRAVLLAGIRCAVLWRQCGGSRWHILFGRRSYVSECKLLLSEM